MATTNTPFTFHLYHVGATVAYEMALEQIIADLDDLEERVENLNVDQKTNEDILLNVLKRVDETEKDLRKVCGGSTLSPHRAMPFFFDTVVSH